MIQRAASWLVAWGSWWLDDAVEPGALRRWLAGKMAAAADWPAARYARGVAGQAGLLADREADRGAADDPMLAAGEPLAGGCLRRKQLEMGAGRRLERLAVENAADALLADETESLLRHVEIARRSSLEVSGQPRHSATAWIERHAVAIYFARQARRVGDLRLLNAALKLNDWAFARHRRRAEGEPLAWYLLALAEQELAVDRLLAERSFQASPRQAA